MFSSLSSFCKFFSSWQSFSSVRRLSSSLPLNRPERDEEGRQPEPGWGGGGSQWPSSQSGDNFPRTRRARKADTSELSYHFPRNLRVFGDWTQYWKLPKAMTINKWITSQIIGELDNVETGSPKAQDNPRNMEWSVGSGWDGGRLRKAVRTSQWGMTLISVFWPQECSAVMGRVEYCR